MCFVRMGVGPLPVPWGAWGVPRWRPLGILDRGIPELSPRRCLHRGLDPSRELLGVGSPRPRPFLELRREQLIQLPSSWATAPGTNQPDTSTRGGSLQNHRDASSWRTGVLLAGHQGTHTARVAL